MNRESGWLRMVRAHTGASYWLAALLVALSFGFWAQSALAQSCEIVEDRWVGNAFNPSSSVFTSMSEITSVSVLTTPWWANCSEGRYWFVEGSNTLNTAGSTTFLGCLISGVGCGCQAEFQVTGIEAGCTPPTDTAGEVAQVPLFLTFFAEPNILFVLDDSGSMHWESMPDAITYTNYLFPRPLNIYGDGQYGRRILSFSDDDMVNRRIRSSGHVDGTGNATFYDPNVEYRPWFKADGNPWEPADPANALHNPAIPGLSGVNLGNQQSFDLWQDWTGSWSYPSETRDFWPITFYVYKGSGSIWEASSYVKYQIRGSTGYRQDLNGGAETTVGEFDWPFAGTRTVAEEKQNFANWYQYYRSRVLASRAGIGAAFSQLTGDVRVGFGTINTPSDSVDDSPTPMETVVAGVRPFEGSDRENWFDALYNTPIPVANTPMRRALDDAGRYFSRSDNAGPWGNTPGDNIDDTAHLECRRSFTILMTDGFWNTSQASTEGARGDNDSTSGPTITGPNDQTYTFEAGSPFEDERANTLADVAMYYWKRDLRIDLDNLLPATTRNPAFWQHMTTYGVGLGVEGNQNPEEAFAAIGSGAEISWANPLTDAGAARIDDLLHAAVNSRGGFFSASEPNEFASELAATLQAIIGETKSSAASVATNSTRLDTDTLIYQARFDSGDWSGEVRAFQFLEGGELGSLVWDTNEPGKILLDVGRNVFTWNGTEGVAFDDGTGWDSLSTDQQIALRAGGTEADGKARVRWLRGNPELEGTLFRSRPVPLGDIVNSNPYFVGKQNYGFAALPGDEGENYADFLDDNATRPAMIYVGANDGMLHGFDAQTGVERMAYVPKGVYAHLAALTDPNYLHRYYVDGSPRALDAYIGDEWRTILLGSTGAGGRSVFAIDVTDPTGVGPDEILWEIEAGELGYTIGQPTIARLESGDWVAIFGNGYGSPGHTAKLMVVDLADGSTLKAIDTLTGDGATPNGLSEVIPVDFEGDGITDVVYAGDLLGNLWKFDLRGESVTDWGVAYTESGAPAPLFTATDSDGVGQPITARPVVVEHPASGQMVFFGTGKFFQTGDDLVDASTQVQSFYGVQDTGVRITQAREDVLQAQEILFQGAVTFTGSPPVERDVRVTSNNSVTSAQRGWYIDLIYGGAVEGERSVTRPVFRDGRIVFSTLIPDQDPCGFGGRSWLMELLAFNGSRPATPVIDASGDGTLDSADLVTVGDAELPISGMRPGTTTGIFGTPTVIGEGALEYKVLSTSDGNIEVVAEQGVGEPRREGWHQLR